MKKTYITRRTIIYFLNNRLENHKPQSGKMFTFSASEVNLIQQYLILRRIKLDFMQVLSSNHETIIGFLDLLMTDMVHKYRIKPKTNSEKYILAYS